MNYRKITLKYALLIPALLAVINSFSQNTPIPDSIQIVKSRFIFNRYVYLLKGNPIDIVKMDSLFLASGNSEAIKFQKKAKVNAFLSKSFAYLSLGGVAAIYASSNRNPSLTRVIGTIFSGSLYISIYSSLRRTYVEKKAVRLYNKALRRDHLTHHYSRSSALSPLASTQTFIGSEKSVTSAKCPVSASIIPLCT